MTSNYKQCILYLKEARGGFALSGRSFTHPQRDVTGNAVMTPKSTDSGLRKLPLLNAYRHLQPAVPHDNHHHGAGVPPPSPFQQCYDSMRHYLHPLPSHQPHLNVLGRPALKGRDGGGGSEDRGRALGDQADSVILSSSRHVIATAAEPCKPPPPPPNTAQGARVTHDQPSSQQRESGGSSSPSPSSAGWPRPDSCLHDPFGRDTWRSGLKHDLPVTSEGEEDRHRKSGGVAFIAPLSSPKALTSREDGGASRKQSYFLVRHLAADLSECPPPKKNK